MILLMMWTWAECVYFRSPAKRWQDSRSQNFFLIGSGNDYLWYKKADKDFFSWLVMATAPLTLFDKVL